MPAAVDGPRKAALLLLQLGPERAARVVQNMHPDEVEAVMAEIARIDDVKQEVMHGVMTEFVTAANARSRMTGGVGFARQVLTAGLGPDEAARMLERIAGPGGESPLRWLSSVDSMHLAAALVEEHPQTIALVLSSLPAGRALAVLTALPEKVQGDVTYRMATMGAAVPEVVNAVEASLRDRLASLSRPAPAEADGEAALVELLASADAATETLILGRLEQLDPELAERIRVRLFTFDDLVQLDDKGIQQLLREVDTKVLALALKGASEAVRSRLFANLSERAAGNLAEEVELLGPQRRKDVDDARADIIRCVRRLEESGAIVLSRGNEGYVD